ncbi:MAG: TrkA family potassium uptake protein [Candidatus Aenigmatarchaeota archaeon]
MRLIICGGGSLGSKLAEVFVKEKHDVIIIEKDDIIAEKLAEKLDALILHGDATELKILKDANVEHSDALIVATSDDKTNLMICEVAKSFHVRKIVSRINDSTNDPIFMELGITAAINTTTASVLSFKKALQDPGKRIIGLVAGDQASIVDRLITKKSRAVNKKINQLPPTMIICALFRNGEHIIPRENTILTEGDIVTVCASISEIKKIDNLFYVK